MKISFFSVFFYKTTTYFVSMETAVVILCSEWVRLLSRIGNHARAAECHFQNGIPGASSGPRLGLHPCKHSDDVLACRLPDRDDRKFKVANWVQLGVQGVEYLIITR